MIWSMTSLEIRVQPWVTLAGGPDMPAWVTRRVESRVEFVLDGRTVSDLGGADDHPETVTVFNLDDKRLAADVLMGRAPLTDWFPPTGRLPLLVCPCGDPGEGTLTVRLSLTKDTVTWDQWAWEHDSFPIERLSLPECRFRLDEYSAAVAEAGRQSALIEGKPTSIIRVANQGDGITRWLDRRVRGELARQVEWLDIDVVHPGVRERSTELEQLLAAMALMRDELAGAKMNRRFVPAGAQSRRVITAASGIVESPEAFRLPEQTLSAVQWLRDYLSAADQRPRAQKEGVYFDDVDPKQVHALAPGQFAILSAYFGASEDNTPKSLMEDIRRRCSDLGMTHEHLAGTHVWQGFLDEPTRQLVWFVQQGLHICEVSED